MYLLVCLPPRQENIALEHSFQEPLTQVHLLNVERLVETEELQCLIIGFTSMWDQTSALWRHQASQILKAVSASSTRNMVPSLLVAVTVFSFIKDTYDLNPALFEVFDTNNGYKALENVLKCCEEGVPADQFPPVEELIELIATFVMFGKTELKVAVCVSNPQPPGFKFDAPQTTVVKNLPAFRLLQESLLRSQDSRLCCQILQTMQRIWEKETANFFLLEWSAQTMTQLASCVLSKPAPVHKLFFSLLEMVSTLTCIVCAEITSTLCRVNNCMLFLHSGLLTEVLSDWGLLNLLLGELRRRAKILIKAVSVTTFSVRELGMVPYIKIFLNEDQYRDATLSILEQLAEINPEEFMSIAIGALCSSTQQETKLKSDLLQSVLKVLESPNSWDAFRKAGGFTGLLSLVNDMEGTFANPPQAEVLKSIGQRPLLEILLLTLHIIALAVHLHRINAHYFETGGYFEKLTEALLNLGCFHCVTSGESYTDKDTVAVWRTFEQFSSLSKSESQLILPVTLRTCIILLSYLNQFSTGTFSCPDLNLEKNCENQKSSNQSNIPIVHDGVEDTHGQRRKVAPSISIASTESQFRYDLFGCDTAILHPGAIRVIMTLFPLYKTFFFQLSMDVQYALIHHIQGMVKSERNRQIMCDGGLITTLLTHCSKMLIEPKHPLHLPVTRILEKLSSQSITLKDFRSFLCLGNPLMCLSGKMVELNLSENEKTPGFSGKTYFSLLNSVGSAIPTHQIISLVSMTSPRTYRPHRISATPAFVEFDMSEGGYGCLFLPSLATVKGVSADSIPIGGTGGDGRGFPPTAGLTYSCWFQINKFSSACESHPIRFLSVVRHMSRTEQQFICLSISLSACDGCLVISTEEEALTYLDMMEQELSSPTSLPTSLRFRCSSLLIPGQWHHLVVVLTKDIKKSCLVSAYLNGKAVGTGKMKYIQPFPGTYVSMEPTAVIDVYAVIGTPALWKDYAALIWKVGSSYMFEEPLTSEAIDVLYSQGTGYLGNFLSVCKSGVESNPVRLVPEERISFGISPAISTVTTVAQIREDYNEVDCRLIAKEMGITSRDNSTPVFFAHNISQHLSGTARTIGAALVGHFGVRTFSPRSAVNGFLYVGGPAVVLSLVAMAPDDSSLYAAVKVLLSVLETDPTMQQEMARIDGYKLLAFLLKSKSSIVSNRTLQLVLCLADSTEANSSSIHQQNVPAFKALISDLDVWQTTSDNLDLTVLNHFAEVLKSFRYFDDNRNAGIMHKIGILPKMLFIKSAIAVCVFFYMLMKNVLWLSRLGLFLVYTLPLQSNTSESSDLFDSHHSTNGVYFIDHIYSICGQVLFETLGCGWFLLFLQPHLHPSTIKLGLALLNQLLLNPSLLSIFREGVSPCSLMEEPSTALDNLRARSSTLDFPRTACSGFDVLKELLITHFNLPEAYEFLVSNDLLSLPLDDTLLSYIDNEENNSTEQLCIEAATILLELVKATINPSTVAVNQTLNPTVSRSARVSSVMQFFCLLHNLRPRDPLWTLPEFLHTLASVIHPLQVLSDIKFMPFFQDPNTQMPEGHLLTLMENVVLFTKTVVQKLYSGTITGDCRSLLHFIADQIVMVR
uniref:Alfy-like armadillo-like repeat domain-containing protein n=1 Tax=Periophthalmus magnuspinnatus TaxID=409849 RepID=A0A3B4B9E8_9GOBI